MPRKKGGRAQIPRRLSPDDQAKTPGGVKLQRLSDQLAKNTPVLALRADPLALAPERLLVFELTGGVLGFEKAVRLVPGLEFLGAEELAADELDKNPTLYLMVPSEGALKEIVSLWRRWQRDGSVPPSFGEWKSLLSQIKDIRPWGPQDRVADLDLEVLLEEASSGNSFVTLELELVFRDAGEQTEAQAIQAINGVGGEVIARSRIEGAAYHALLCRVPAAALKATLDRQGAGLSGEESVFQIRPQSILNFTPIDEVETATFFGAPTVPIGEPIAAIFDAVPLSRHPRLLGTLSIDDPFNLEPLSVGQRKHGTAMASAVVHGDLSQVWSRPIERKIHFVNMLYATANSQDAEKFPDRLPADLFEEAVTRMKAGKDPTAPHVVIINASLGDPNKPFVGRVSGWARVVDHLSAKYGVLFVISAGNHTADLVVQGLNTTQFESLPTDEKARAALRASGNQMGTRRILAPAESMNALTVGAYHADAFANSTPLPSGTFDVWDSAELCTISSGLGPGQGGATKPDLLANGGRHHINLLPQGADSILRPLRTNAGAFGGVSVAAPPTATAVGLDARARSVGSSVAAALVTGVAARAHEALEAAYPDFTAIPSPQRAVLLKALLVHGSRWTKAKDLLIEVLGPADKKQHYRQKDNVRRYLGNGVYDPDKIMNCSEDRATVWAVGTLGADQGKRFEIPWPAAMSGKAKPHSVHATLAWFSPPRPNALSYRSVRMKIVEPGQLGAAGVKTSGVPQPDPKQSHKGTVVHRRWEGEKAAAIAGTSFFEIDVQREADAYDPDVSYSLVVTLEMAGEAEVYSQVLNRLAIRPIVGVGV